MKWKKMLAAAAAVTLFLSGCGGSTMDTAEIEALLSQAKNTMATVESMAAEMTMEMDMGMNGETLESTAVASIRSQQNPLRMAMDMSMVMDDGTEIDRMQMYAVEEDGHLKTYMSMADLWYAETVEMGALSQYNAEENMDLYLDNITKFTAGKQEEIGGAKTTKISGVITGDAMEELLQGGYTGATAESMGLTEEMLQDIYAELADLPISLWIDADGYVRKYELDMTEMMQKLMDKSREAFGNMESESEDRIDIKIEKTAITMVCSDFNAIEEIEIPAEALGMSGEEQVQEK